MPFARCRDLDLYFELHGAGPPLLFISGTGNDLRYGDTAANPLNAHFTVAHFDQRGLGQSSVPDGPYTMADYADDAAALLDHLGWATVAVVGVSFGGMVAQNLAIRHPARIGRLVLACTSSGGAGGSSYDLRSVADLDEAERADTQLAILDTRYDPGSGKLPPGVAELMSGRGSQPEAAGARLQLDARSSHDVYEQLPDVDARTLVIGGRYDGIAPVSNLEAIAAQLPNSTLELCDGGHIFMFQDPSAWPRILEFVCD